ncbi:uncharacterized protein HKW66_Vig0077970 [Vigna angularis]|uniref:Uncharacterized protein n=1 Tax=Phaseolus angularis TaxID=3914 RepID=A0A8T0K5S1_PHAAN|nr:uncharacterized protein HKW66_Vig0077970 [Vigna angularis]
MQGREVKAEKLCREGTIAKLYQEDKAKKFFRKGKIEKARARRVVKKARLRSWAKKESSTLTPKLDYEGVEYSSFSNEGVGSFNFYKMIAITNEGAQAMGLEVHKFMEVRQLSLET